jgi:putative SOS response-associated peptidase YedK
VCGRFGVANYEILPQRFDVISEQVKQLTLEPSYNIAPTNIVATIVRHSPNSLELMRWGFMPHWGKDKKGVRELINAKAEGLATSRTFKKAFQFQRCIIPASFFFEWQKGESGKTPYCIKPTGEEVFGFAGLWFEMDSGHSCVIITTAPNSLMEPIHSRMPAILRRADEDRWLDPDETEPENLGEMLRPYPAREMEAYPISTAVNSPRNKGAEIIKRVG